jgi:hypothetical protein
MSKVVPVREFMKFKPKELMSGLKQNHSVLFEDNVVLNLTSREIIVNRYVFGVLELVPELAIRSEFSITNFYTNGIYTAKTINKAFEVILEAIVVAYIKPLDNREFLPVVYERMYNIFNDIYNEVTYDNIHYAVSINIKDFLDIQFDPELISAMKDVYTEKTLETVNKTYEILERIIYTKPELRNNIIARGYISGTFNKNQVNQMLASRGYVTEIDSSIFKYPIASSFTLGMSDLYDLAVESRSGAKALFLSNKAIQTSEYSARELQLVTMMVENLVDGDCGNKDYLHWYVRGPEITGKSDIDNLIGKRFLNEDTGREEVITKKHKYLEGNTIKLRIATKCKLPDKRQICTACFGELSYGIHKHTSIGHICSTTLTQQISQNILSTKHITSNATTGDIVLDKNAEMFFNVKSKNGYGFKPGIIGKKNISYRMIVTQFAAFGIKDLNKTVDVYTLNISRVTRIDSFILVVNDNGKDKYYPIVVKEGSKYGSFTYEFLKYIINTGYVLDDMDRYVMDLSGWKSTIPFIVLPQVEFNFLALSKDVTSMFKHMEIVKGVRSSETQESLLQSLFDTVNTKLNVNIALLEVIVYAFSIMSIKDKNYDLGRNSDDTQLMKIEGILPNRSAGGSYAWERVIHTILSPGTFNGRNACDHPLDVLLSPNKTILDYYGSIVN